MSQVVGSKSSYKPITNTAWVRAQLCKLQKGYTRLAAASDKVYTSCLPRLGGSLRVLRLPPPLKLVAMIQLKVALNIKIQIQIHQLFIKDIHVSPLTDVGIIFKTIKKIVGTTIKLKLEIVSNNNANNDIKIRIPFDTQIDY